MGFNYTATHASTEDGSDAMLVKQVGDLMVLINEDGEAWSAELGEWEPIRLAIREG